MSFDGSSGSIAIANTLSVSSTFTVEAWARTSSSSATQAIVGSGALGFSLEFKPGFIHSAIGSGTAVLNGSADAKFAYKTNTWYHIVETVSAGAYEIYVNGVQIGSGVYTGTALLANPANVFKIGQNGATDWFAGSLDEVAIYGGVLSPQAVTAHWAEGAATVLNDVQTLYDKAGNPTSVSDDRYIAGRPSTCPIQKIAQRSSGTCAGRALVTGCGSKSVTRLPPSRSWRGTDATTTLTWRIGGLARCRSVACCCRESRRQGCT